MTAIAWSDDLAIDDSQIDFQHRQLIDSLADLAEALAAADPQRVAAATPFLRIYAQVHFADEERALELVNWPHLAEHRALHNLFRKRLSELEEAMAHGDLMAGTVMLDFLSQWLQSHIRVVDHQFAAEIKALRARR